MLHVDDWMNRRVGVVGAGVSGLTCGVLLAEQGNRVEIFADETGAQTTSAVAAAMWFPYDCEPRDRVIAWALETYRVLVDLAGKLGTGVSMMELRTFSREPKIEIPDWASELGVQNEGPAAFVMSVPLTDTTIYLDYLAKRFSNAGGRIHRDIRLAQIEDIDPAHQIVINCAGFGARKLVNDVELEPHRGQVAIMPKIDNLARAVVCDDPPLMYAIPRTNDCVFGGTNELSDSREVDPATTARIIDECSRVLKTKFAQPLTERVGIRPFRKTGVRLERETLSDGRVVIHNYGHGGSGFTLSWGCAGEVVDLVATTRGNL